MTCTSAAATLTGATCIFFFFFFFSRCGLYAAFVSSSSVSLPSS